MKYYFNFHIISNICTTQFRYLLDYNIILLSQLKMSLSLRNNFSRCLNIWSRNITSLLHVYACTESEQDDISDSYFSHVSRPVTSWGFIGFKPPSSILCPYLTAALTESQRHCTMLCISHVTCDAVSILFPAMYCTLSTPTHRH